MFTKMNKGTVIIVKDILGETARKVLKKTKDGKYRFTCDAYVIGVPCNGGFIHLFQARKFIYGKKFGNNILSSSNLREVLKAAGVKPIRVPGGASYPIHYEDEIVIPDFDGFGEYFFLIKSSDVEKYSNQPSVDETDQSSTVETAQRKVEEE